MKDCFGVDLTEKKPFVELLQADYVQEVLKMHRVKKVEDLSTYDKLAFSSGAMADKFLDKYYETLKDLIKNHRKYNLDDDLPTMPYKRRYLVLTLMKKKMETVRTYRKNWTKGQKFNFSDRTYKLTVILKDIEEMKDGRFKYSFKLAKY